MLRECKHHRQDRSGIVLHLSIAQWTLLMIIHIDGDGMAVDLEHVGSIEVRAYRCKIQRSCRKESASETSESTGGILKYPKMAPPGQQKDQFPSNMVGYRHLKNIVLFNVVFS